jgi:Homeodomain-like domain
MLKYHQVSLAPEEREELLALIQSGTASARTLTHARILLHADTNQPEGGWFDQDIAEAVLVGTATIERVRKRFARSSMDVALYRKPQPKRPPSKMTGEVEAHLIALTCSAPPDGRKRWTLRLLANGMVEAGYVDALSHEAVRKTLKKTNSSLG